MKTDLTDQKDHIIMYINNINNYRLQSFNTESIKYNSMNRRLTLVMNGTCISVPFDYKHYKICSRILKINKIKECM